MKRQAGPGQGFVEERNASSGGGQESLNCTAARFSWVAVKGTLSLMRLPSSLPARVSVGIAAVFVTAAGLGAAGAAASSVASPLSGEGPGYGGNADELAAVRVADGLLVTGFGFLAGSTVTVHAGEVVVVATADGVGALSAVVPGVEGTVVVHATGLDPSLEPITLWGTAW
jgi:hypothetical protein